MMECVVLSHVLYGQCYLNTCVTGMCCDMVVRVILSRVLLVCVVIWWYVLFYHTCCITCAILSHVCYWYVVILSHVLYGGMCYFITRVTWYWVWYFMTRVFHGTWYQVPVCHHTRIWYLVPGTMVCVILWCSMKKGRNQRGNPAGREFR